MAPKRALSPKPPSSLKKTVKISQKQRTALKKLKKNELFELATLAGERPKESDTKSTLSHRLARNKYIALGIASVGVVGLLGRYFGKKSIRDQKIKKLLEIERQKFQNEIDAKRQQLNAFLDKQAMTDAKEYFNDELEDELIYNLELDVEQWVARDYMKATKIIKHI